jgi:hypothetical protein
LYFFLLGMYVLTKVDLKRGTEVALAEETQMIAAER